jgi:hypothetical protein
MRYQVDRLAAGLLSSTGPSYLPALDLDDDWRGEYAVIRTVVDLAETETPPFFCFPGDPEISHQTRIDPVSM